MALGLAWLMGGGNSGLRGGRVVLEEPRRAHHSAWAELRDASRAHLVPFEPQWSADELTRQAFRRRLRRYRFDRRQGTGLPFFVFRASDHTLLGGVTLSNIRRGVTQTASVGYWVGQPFVRQGYTSEALGAVLRHAFQDLGLNRVEAACMPVNRASIGVLEKAGFRREGLARRYLRINGVFEDHLLFGRLRDDAGHEAGIGGAPARAPALAEQSSASLHAQPHSTGAGATLAGAEGRCSAGGPVA